MPTILDTPLSRRSVFLSLFGIFVAFPVTGYVAITWRPRRFYRSYKQLTLDMSETSVVVLFGRKPDGVCTYGKNRILYYSRSAISDKRPPAQVMNAQNTGEIPWFYGCAQLLFDTHGTLSAYTVNGEEAHISTREGEHNGSCVCQIEEAILERLRRPEI